MGPVGWRFPKEKAYQQCCLQLCLYLLIERQASDQLNLPLEAQCTLRSGSYLQPPLTALKHNSHNRDLLNMAVPTEHLLPVR